MQRLELLFMIKQHQIYKKDKWNMLNVEVNGTRFIIREISDQWGEESQTVLSRAALQHWAQERFSADRYDGSEEERQAILDAIKQV
jgi:hypothetical protein